MQSGITASAKKSVLAWLDADGDGSVSIAEAEQGARAGLHRCEEKLSAVCGALAPFKDSLVMGGGPLSASRVGLFSRSLALRCFLPRTNGRASRSVRPKAPRKAASRNQIWL